ncbi:MAG: hypothetical protein ACT4OS_01950 [Acidimicrobiales bacterium]
MAWSAEDLPSQRSPEEVLDAVLRRGTRLATRRRLGAGAAALLGTVLVLPTGILAIVDGPGSSVAGARPAGSAKVASAQPVDPGPASTVPVATPESTTTAPVPQAPPVVGDGGTVPAPPPPVPPTPPTTSRRPRPSVTTPPVTVGRPPSGPAVPACGPSYLEAQAKSLLNSYDLGEPVYLEATLTNVSSQPCTFRSFTTAFTVDNDGDPQTPPVLSDAEVVNRTDGQLAAGETLAVPSRWTAIDCHLSPCPPGTYEVIYSWAFDDGPRRSASATFVVKAPPTTTVPNGQRNN